MSALRFKKWKTLSGSIVMARDGLSLPERFIEELFSKGEEFESSGRGAIRKGTLPSGESYILRPYRRGGLVQHLSEESFISFPTSSYRPFIELEITAQLFDAGVKVPMPLFAVVVRSALRITYTGAIATQEIRDSENLLVGSQTWSLDKQRVVARSSGYEAGKMLLAGIYHRDLHPANVLVKGESEVFLIDFDKAIRIGQTGLSRYADRLVERWGRAVKKRGLNEALTKEFVAGLEDGASLAVSRLAVK